MNISAFKTVTDFDPAEIVPGGAASGNWVGRVWIPASRATNHRAGPRVVAVTDGMVRDLSPCFLTMTDLINHSDPVGVIRDRLNAFPEIIPLKALIENSLFPRRASSLADETQIVLLAPNDLSATRACGVTFIQSLLERVIEEKAAGDPTRASAIRGMISETLGDDLSSIHPGSPETEALKQRFIAAGVWSQYLEVGIGPDAEIFTKAQPMSSVGFGAQIGVLPDSSWNNPEPEVVLTISSSGQIVGATLGNDVNLRDYEGRSALLLGEAKDQNGSCAIGPLVRLFDQGFSLEDIKRCEVELKIAGEDGFHTCGRNRMAEISRSPEQLAAKAIGAHHQYPDGLFLFLGTMFAPIDDRDAPGQGFTHHLGDRVEIATPLLGRLVNWVNHTHAIPRWDYGTRQLIEFLIQSKT